MYPFFCQVRKNIAFDHAESKFYKWFYKSEHRQPNLSLVNKYMDETATVVNVNNDEAKPIYMEMTNLGFDGTMGDSGYEASSLSFRTITRKLWNLHRGDYVHGDIRLANLVLCDERSCIVDFDFAGKVNEPKYPLNLALIQDGERHPEVEEAIEGRKLNVLPLKFEHDWFSLAAVMKLFKPTKGNDDTKWEEFCNFVQDFKENKEDDERLDNVLEQLGVFTLEIDWGKKEKKKDKVCVSGSPPKYPVDHT